MLESVESLLRLNMTSNFAPSPLHASHSSQWSVAFAAWNAFNGNANIGASETGWRSNNASMNEWLQIDFGVQRLLAGYSIHRASLTATNAPSNFTFSGSNDGADWTELDSRSGITWGADVVVQRFEITPETAFRWYRLAIAKASTAAVGIGQLDFTEVRPVEWFLDSDINIHGYPHPAILKSLPSGEQELINFAPSSEHFQFIWSADSLGWSIDDRLRGYPHTRYRDLIPPVLPPVVVSITLGHTTHFAGLASDLIVELNLRHLQSTDTIILEIRNSSNQITWETTVSSAESGHQALVHTVSGSVMENFDVDNYSVRAFIRRGIEESSVASATLAVSVLPYIDALTLSPTLIKLPTSTENNQVEIDYTMNGIGVESIANTFSIGNSSITEIINASELLEIQSTTPTGGFWNANFNFQVTDTDFRIISLKFRFNQHHSNTEVRYNINGSNVMIVPRPSNSPAGWIEWTAPEPRHLPMGSNTIQVTNNFGDFVMFSTTNRPTVHGMNITSATVWAMEMVYSLSTSGVESGVTRTATLTIEDDIDLGSHPLVIESEMMLAGFGKHTVSSTTDLSLQVVTAPTIENVYINPNELTTLSPPTTIETKWLINADFLAGEVFSVVGEIGIEGTEFSQAIETDALEFTAIFHNIILSSGYHAFSYDITIAHDDFGDIPMAGSVADLINVELILPPPQIVSVELNHSGRYIGAEIDVTLTTLTADIASGDSIEITLWNNGEDVFSYADTLAEGVLSYSQTIPTEYFVGLPAGEHTIEIKLIGSLWSFQYPTPSFTRQ